MAKTSRKQLIVRKYRCTDAALIQKADFMIGLLVRDAADLAAYGLNTAFKDSVKLARDKMSDTSTDEELLGYVVEATYDKNKKRDEVRRQIRQIAHRAAIKYGDNDIRFRLYGISALSLQTDNELVRTGREVVRVANLQLAELASEGLTQGAIDQLLADTRALDDLIDQKIIAIKNRDMEVEARVTAGNELHALLVTISSSGKLCYEEGSPAKHSQYMLTEQTKHTLQVTEGDVKPKLLVNISAYVHRPTAKLVLTNLGEGPLTFYYGAEPTDFPDKNYTSVPPGQSKTVSAAILGYVKGTLERLIAYNPGTLDGKYQVQWE